MDLSAIGGSINRIAARQLDTLDDYLMKRRL